ncbi:MAG: hypothetical protein EOP11_23180 [Proteobacteria bacterium]|nr:MAG: hypothetical protein EOP11_23180 [Pseudomonadota bacterium]
MKTILLLAAALGLFCLPAFAASIEEEVAAAIVANQASIVLLNEVGMAYEKNLQLPSIISKYFSGENVVCTDVTPAGLVGAQSFNCVADVSIFLIEAPVTRGVYPGAKAQLRSLKLKAAIPQ